MLKISVIIPALNEAAQITTCIQAVRQIDPTVEVIVTDGGSEDDTPRLARAAGAKVINAPRGRGLQLNAGAALAGGDLLVFLHADTRLPANAFTLLQAMFADPQVQIAKFCLSFDDPDWLLALAARLMWFDSLLTSYGDQCMVLRRNLFEALGGFPDWPLLEDVELFRRARAVTRVHVVPAQVVTSARRFRANGIVRQLLHDFWLWLQYLVGVSPYEIARQYR
ncbi:TIGR04283 family arsenosugar biosynthesis glycosyltransferase [Chloroflexus sp.]|uniref:TIGR04283 family arsenosugar biosynthesis glycosyltransferase n=1 Tax=Chloroflexus sp. TaxID=1904827 RepID=UPI002ADD5482|nr:TIGR04283 family arsenosugar biosynthesis glycosyltransferase [Chloroflexus sp.]